MKSGYKCPICRTEMINDAEYTELYCTTCDRSIEYSYYIFGIVRVKDGHNT